MFKLEEEEDSFAHELHEAITRQQDVVRLDSLSDGLDARILNIRDQAGKTLLGYAIETGKHVLVQKLLLERADPNVETHNKSPLMLAILQGTSAIIDQLLLFGAKEHDVYELYHQAIKKRSTAIIGSLVRSGFDINVRAADNSFVLVDAVLSKNFDLIETCLRLGADREMRDDQGRTVLQYLQELQNPNRQELKQSGRGGLKSSGRLQFSQEQLKCLAVSNDKGDPVVDEPGYMSRVTDEEIINFLQKSTSRWGDGNQKLYRVKGLANRFGEMSVDDAIEMFARLDRAEQKDVLLFVPLHLHMRLKNAGFRISPAHVPEFGSRDESGMLSSNGSNTSCVLQ